MSLKRIVKSAFNQDPLQQIFWGHPTNDTYNKVIQNYQIMSSEGKDQTVNRIFKKMRKPKQTELVIANLTLLHKVMKINTVYLPSIEPLIQQSKKKQYAGEKSFIKFYYSFLKLTQRQILMKRQSFEDNLDYCEIALTKCFDIIKNNIVIDYCIQHSTNQINLRIALRQIFEDIQKDLFFTTDIIERNVKRIYQESTTISFSLNQIYEKLLQLNKSLIKITVLIKKANLSISLPVYELERDINMKIEMEMNLRKDEKVKFKTEKLIKSQKNIQIQGQIYQPRTMKQINYEQGSCNNYQYLSEIEQGQILIHHYDQIY